MLTSHYRSSGYICWGCGSEVEWAGIRHDGNDTFERYICPDCKSEFRYRYGEAEDLDDDDLDLEDDDLDDDEEDDDEEDKEQ